MTVPVLWVSRHPEILARGYADEGLLEAILDRSLWTPPAALAFEHHEVRGDFPDVEGALVVLPARHHTSRADVNWFVTQLERLWWSVVILAGDEEWAFPWREVPEGPRRRVWIMQPQPAQAHRSGLIPGGWYPGTREGLVEAERTVEARRLDWFFAGQVTHERREACAAALRGLDGGYLYETAGYLQGMPRRQYMALLASSKVVPCPSGPESVDTARPLEALEAGCVPVVDELKPKDPQFDYWSLCFGADHPLPTISDWSTFGGMLKAELGAWPANANRVFAWWQRHKRDLALALDDQLREVRAGAVIEDASPDDLVTVIVPTSPIPAHPDTAVISETVASVRAQLPLAQVVIVADGVRPELEHRREAYDEYLRRLLWQCNYDWHNVAPLVLESWGHQANATRAALEEVRSPLVLYVEHDTPLVGDVDWDGLCRFVRSGQANAVRLHIDVEIHPDHEHMMLDHETSDIDGLPLRRTAQWWQRPHLASARFYRERVMPYFGAESRTMIEDRMHSVVECAWRDHGEAGWWDWRVWVYTPPGNMQRSRHLDGRGTDPKFSMHFVPVP